MFLEQQCYSIGAQIRGHGPEEDPVRHTNNYQPTTGELAFPLSPLPSPHSGLCVIIHLSLNEYPLLFPPGKHQLHRHGPSGRFPEYHREYTDQHLETTGSKDHSPLLNSVAHFSPLWLSQGTVGEVLGNVEAAQDFLNTNTTQIVETVSTAMSHMSWKKKCSMWSVNACGGSVI